MFEFDDAQGLHMVARWHRNHTDGDGRIVSISPLLYKPDDSYQLHVVCTTDKGNKKKERESVMEIRRSKKKKKMG